MLRQKWGEILVGGTNLNVADPAITSAIAKYSNSGSNYWSSMNKSVSRTYLWSDAASSNNSSHITTSFNRLGLMAMAYATTNSSLQNNAALASDINSALDWMYTYRYNETKPQYDNWWDWEIGAPMALNDVCVLMYDVLTPSQIANYMSAVNFFTPAPDMTQANTVWKARVVGVRGCLVKDAAKLALVREAVSTVFPYVTTGDGYYRDGSFIQHDIHPYNGGYGASLLGNLIPMLNWMNGSTWQITDSQRTNVFRWIYDAFEPVIYRGTFMDMVRGREISRYSSSGSAQGIMADILQLSQMAPTNDAARMKSMVKYWAQADTVRNFVSNAALPDIPLIQQVLADTNVVPRGELVGHYTFADMDRVVHLRPDYGFGISMYSIRTGNYEGGHFGTLTTENHKGWYTAYGMTYVYGGDLNQYGDNFWPTVDPYRLPGTTVDTQIRTDYSGASALGSNSWVGGATLGKYGAAGMQLNAWNSTLMAKKSWFMFDNEIVCLGAGITASDGGTVETIIENRKLVNIGGINPFTVDGSAKPSLPGWSETMMDINWAQLKGNVSGADIGYYFPQPMVVKGLREARTHSWSEINSGGTTNLYTRNYLTLWFDHGVNPTNATYAYALLPNRSVALVADYAAHPQFTVLENSANIQGVRETSLGITAVNFWNDGTNSLGGITVDRKASVLVQNDGTYLDVAVCDPTQSGTSVTVEIAVPSLGLMSADSGVTVLQTSPTTRLVVNVNGGSGRSLSARFFVGTPHTFSTTAVADTYVQDGENATNNFGSSASLICKRGNAGANYQSYLRFYLGALPAVAKVFNATLRLNPSIALVPGLHAVSYVPNTNWTESGLTWNSRSGSGATTATWTPQTNAPVVASILSSVQTALTNGKHMSLCVYPITQTLDGFVSYDSRETTVASNQPTVSIVYGVSPPKVTLTSPADGTVLSRPTPITLTADAVGTNGEVTGVFFYDGITLLGSNSISPYTLTVPALVGGVHRITAVAVDSNGLTNSSAPVMMEVVSGPTAGTTNVNTLTNAVVNIDLWTLAGDVETGATNLLFTIDAVSNGTASLLADGHTVRFTPAVGYIGPVTFAYTVTDTTSDSRLLSHYNFQPPDASTDALAADTSGNLRDGLLTAQGTGTYAYTPDVPPALARFQTQTLLLTENSTNGAARIERPISTSELNFGTDDWSVTGWFKRKTNNNLDVLFHLGSGGTYNTNSELYLRFDSGSGNLLRLQNASTSNDVTITKANVLTNQWHHFAIVRGGGTLSLYVDGALAGSDTSFTITIDQSKPVAFGGNSDAASTAVWDRWFNGSLADLAIFKVALTPADIGMLTNRTVSHFGGIVSSNTISINVYESNTVPVLASVSNRTITAGTMLVMTNVATDPNVPPQVLAYSLLVAPSGAVINASNGVMMWRPGMAQADTTNLITLKVTDNGTPSLSATQSFLAIVSKLSPVRVTAPVWTNGQMMFVLNGDIGPDYLIQTSVDLTNWTAVFTNAPSAMPWNWTDNSGSNSLRRFYRILLGP